MSSDFLSSLLGNVWSIFLIVLFFGGSIFVHELGHFLAARRRGVKVTRFSIGFGPAIWKWQGKDGVDYRLSWLPLGGYVALPQLADMPALEGESENTEPLPPVDYTSRMIVFVAGAFFNILFAFALACVVWIIGEPVSSNLTSTTIAEVLPVLKTSDGKEVVSPARKADLKPGDIIVKVDGEAVATVLTECFLVLSVVVLGQHLRPALVKGAELYIGAQHVENVREVRNTRPRAGGA